MRISEFALMVSNSDHRGDDHLAGALGDAAAHRVGHVELRVEGALVELLAGDARGKIFNRVLAHLKGGFFISSLAGGVLAPV